MVRPSAVIRRAAVTLAKPKSLSFSRPVLFHYIASRAALEATSRELFDVVAAGTVRINVNQRYPLKEAAQAHADLESRATTGSTVLLT